MPKTSSAQYQAAEEHDDPASAQLLRLRDVRLIIPLSRSAFLKGVKEGLYPRPVRIGKRAVAWRRSEIVAVAENGVADSQLARHAHDSRINADHDLSHDLAAAKREKETLLKLVAGMIIGGYGGFPAEGRSSLASEIASDCERAGVPTDRDTILKFIRQAREKLPPAI